MLSLEEIQGTKDLSGIYRISKTEVRFLWHSDYWDGPLNGVALYREQKYWFQCIDEAEEKREFLLVEINEEQLNELEKWQSLFRENVGPHTDYDEKGKQNTGELKPESQWEKFYKPYKAVKDSLHDFHNNEVVGRFKR